MDKTVADVFGLTPPKPYKSKQNPDKCSNDGLLIGLELEIENIPEGQDTYQQRVGSFWSVIEDGSLRPRFEAWEFVSRPATLGVALAELRIFFDRMKLSDRNYTDRTSIHVHTNVQDFTQAQVANIALVYPVFESVLFQFVNHYKAKEKQGYCRDTNLYCVPWSQCRMNRNFIEKFFSDPSLFVPDRRGLGTRQWEKYTALNFIPIASQGTIEWRHMHGTADMEKLTIWLNLIGSIMRYCRSNSFDDIVRTIKVMNDVSTYQQFFTTVLGDTLPYLEEYRAPMAEGVVNAKYSLINWEANKNKPKPEKKEKSLYEGFTAAVEEAPITDEERAEVEQILAQERERVRQQAGERLVQRVQGVRAPANPLDWNFNEDLWTGGWGNAAQAQVQAAPQRPQRATTPQEANARLARENQIRPAPRRR